MKQRYDIPLWQRNITQDDLAKLNEYQYKLEIHTMRMINMEENSKPVGVQGHPIDAFNSLLSHLKAAKPNDRSEADRYFAIVITEVEKARAVFLTYCTKTVEE